MSNPWDYIAKLVCIGDSGTGKSSLTIRLCEGRFSPSHDVTIGVEFGSRIVSVGPRSSSLSSAPSSAKTANGTPSLSSSSPSHQQTQQPNDSTPKQKKMKLSLWDTAGQETYKSITRSYFRGASGALLVFDLTRRETFDSVTQWLDDLRQLAEPDIVVVLVGNKSDLALPEPPSSSSSPSPSSAAPNEASRGANDSTTEHTGLSNPNKNKSNKRPRAISRSEAETYCKSHGIIRYVETSAKSGQGVENAFLEVAQRIYENIERGRYDLNDRRSGVKGHGGGGAGTGGGGKGGGGAVRLGMNDVTKGGARGGCC